MVKTLEVQVSGLLNLKKFVKDNGNYTTKCKDSYQGYACDCDQFGGGDPPCDCDRK